MMLGITDTYSKIFGLAGFQVYDFAHINTFQLANLFGRYISILFPNKSIESHPNETIQALGSRKRRQSK